MTGGKQQWDSSLESRKYAWIDVETTGFTKLSEQMAYKHCLLEMAIVLTDSDLNPFANLNVVIHHKPEDYLPVSDEVVMKMHTDNGLFAECEKSSLSLKEAETQILAFFKENGVNGWEARLCGNSVYLDRVFIEIKMPKLSDFIHYRNMDMSSVNEFLLTVSPQFATEKGTSHRAMGDIMESIREGKKYQTTLRAAVAALAALGK